MENREKQKEHHYTRIFGWEENPEEYFWEEEGPEESPKENFREERSERENPEEMKRRGYLNHPDRSKDADYPQNSSDARRIWAQARDELIGAIVGLGFPAELGTAIAKHLGSPKAIERMTKYLHRVKPGSVELVVDEMLAIRSEIDAWRERKAAREANAAYNRIMYYGLETEEEEF